LVLSVIIVNYNVKYFLAQCLCSVEKAIALIDAEVIVVDNHSLDGSIDYLKPLFPGVHFLSNPLNEGFSKANNSALRVAQGKYIVFLNPDTLVGEACFSDCIAFLENTANAGAIGVRMIDGCGKFLPESKRSFPSLLSSFFKLVGLADTFPASKLFNHYALGHINQNKTSEVSVLAGAFMMVKKEVLDTINGFDEDFFMYGEDIDLSFRIQQAGYKNYYLGKTAIIHFKGESVRKEHLNYTALFYNAINVFVQKHYGLSNRKPFSLFMLLAIALSRFTATIKQVVRLVLLNNNINTREQETLIIGSQQEYQKVFQLLEENGLANTIIGRITILEEETNRMAFISELKEWQKRGKPLKIIFCAGELGYSEIISAIQSISYAAFLFYANKTNTIVGSHQKTRVGNTIA